MTRDFFNKQFAGLVNAYSISNKLSDESQDVYWEMLNLVPEKEFAKGVRHCLATCKFFPTIAELGQAAMPTKEKLSSYMVQTRNGMDRVKLQVSWVEQIEELQGQLLTSRESKQINS